MMTDEQLIAKFLELQDQQEQMTDEQVQQALDDQQMRELAEQMAFAKRAFKNEEVQNETPPVDEEWAKFADSHFERQNARRRLFKVAASFIGILMVSGITLAAISIVRSSDTPEAKTQGTEQTISAKSVSEISSDTISIEPRVFDNVTLDKMLTEIAAAYHVSAEFRNKDARQLRFHFVWKREDNLERTVEKLNTFEAVDIIIDNEKLIVR